MANFYKDYFEIDKAYYPEVNEHNKNNVDWRKTYPHETFVELLDKTERMLARGLESDKKGIWIEGAYGTGKSRVALTLKNILECSNDELKAYFEADANLPLHGKKDLLKKLQAHKSGKIVTAWRYSSGSINSISSLVAAVFESTSNALKDAEYDTCEARTLRGSIVRYFSQPAQKIMLGELIKQEKYSSMGAFAGKSVDSILDALRNDSEHNEELVRALITLAKDEGITGLSATMEDLMQWLKDVIVTNGLSAFVLIWDEFSSYFKCNRTTLDQFQRLAELSNEVPFYLVIVTHESGSLLGEDRSSRIVSDRFKHVSIEIPDTIAFELIGSALVIKDSQREYWNTLKDDLADRTRAPREAVRKYAWNGTSGGEGVLERILPIHPMAALMLKNISKNFASNQRSMFNFIWNEDGENQEAFQKFIATRSPDDGDILGIDYLWDFFYVHGTDSHSPGTAGRGNLEAGIRAILDVYVQNEGRLGTTEEKRVLKTVLMMQAMNTNLGNSVKLLSVTEQNLNLAFAGIEGLENRAVIIAKDLCRREILFERPLSDGKTEFNARTTGGDPARIQQLKNDIRNQMRTAALVNDGKLDKAIRLTPAQTFRFYISSATKADFKTVVNQLANKACSYQIYTMYCFAMDENEGAVLREMIKEAVSNPQNAYKNIVFVDITQNTLSTHRKEQWIEYKAHERAVRDSDRAQSEQYARDAEDILKNWQDDIASGQFTVYWDGNKNGRNCSGSSQVLDEFANIVSTRYPFASDALKGLSEQMFATSSLAEGARRGIEISTGGRFQEVAVNAVLGAARSVPEYWDNPSTSALPISKLYNLIDKKIGKKFRDEGRISIDDITEFLIAQGYMPCNVYAYLTGFLLRNYSRDPYRWSDEATGGPMTKEKLSEIIAASYKQITAPNNRYRPVFIQIMTPEQKAFANFSKTVFGFSDDLSIEQLRSKIKVRLSDLGWPLWMVSDVVEPDVRVFIDKIAAFVNPQNSGDNASNIASEVGRLLASHPGISEEVKSALDDDAVQEAAKKSLEVFDNGEFKSRCDAINAKDVLEDVKRVFTRGDGSWLWNRDVGEQEIRNVGRDYSIVKLTSDILGGAARSLAECIEYWKELVKSTRFPSVDIVAKKPAVKAICYALKEIERTGDISPEKRDSFLSVLRENPEDVKNVFGPGMSKEFFHELYSASLTGLSESDISEVYARLPVGSFQLDRSQYLEKLATEADSVRRRQIRYRLEEFWREKTNTRDAADWSRINKTPAIAMFPINEETQAVRALQALDRAESTDEDVRFALEWLGNRVPMLELMNDGNAIDDSFRSRVVHPFEAILMDLDDVRRRLDNAGIEPSNWLGESAKRIVEAAANESYARDGAQKLISRIDRMNGDKLRAFVKRLVSNNVRIGVEMLAAEEE